MVRIRANPEQAIDLIVASGRAAAARAAMHMAYGLNATDQAGDADHHLSGFIQLVDAPQELLPAEKQAFREEHRSWIVAHGFRDLLEGMETFLNALFRIVISAERHRGRQRDNASRKLIREFERKGVSGKLETFERRYGIDTGFGHYFRSLTQARNCLAHRSGVVGDEDCETDGAFRLIWFGVDAMITEGDGTKHYISLNTLGPIDSSKFSQDANPRLAVMFLDRERRITKGEPIAASARSLQEICAMSSFTCLKMRQLTLNWLQMQGISVNGGKPVPDPAAEFFLSYESKE